MTAKAARITGFARIAALIACLASLTGLVLLLARPGLVPRHVPGAGTARIQPIELVGLAWIIFGCALWLARKTAVRVVAGLVLIGGIALQLAALTGPPQNSSDLYRYMWDGRVQAAGIDPYHYAPADAGVARLRNDFLWSGTGRGHYVDCVPDEPDRLDPARSLVAGCTKLNRPRVPTIYPPVAEAYFTAIQLAAPADNSTTPVQAAAAVFAVLTTLILLYGLRRLGRDLRLAALWAWCPTVALEAGQNGHVDVVGVAFTAAALLLLAHARTTRRKIAGGVLLGLAIATKVTPVLAVPGVLRRGWRLICGAALAAIVIVYIPHVIAVGSDIIGFFPGYLRQEGYTTGSGYAVIGLIAHGKAAMAIAFCVLGLIALAIIRYCDPGQPWRGGVLMTSAALAVCTPNYQWYAILLVMLVALDGEPEWLAIAAGGYLANSPNLYIHGFVLRDPRLAGYGGGAAVACALALLRLVMSRRARRAGAAAHAAADDGPVFGALEEASAATALAQAGQEEVPGKTGSYHALTEGAIAGHARPRHR
jgi:hypothetical protein